MFPQHQPLTKFNKWQQWYVKAAFIMLGTGMHVIRPKQHYTAEILGHTILLHVCPSILINSRIAYINISNSTSLLPCQLPFCITLLYCTEAIQKYSQYKRIIILFFFVSLPLSLHPPFPSPPCDIRKTSV